MKSQTLGMCDAQAPEKEQEQCACLVRVLTAVAAWCSTHAKTVRQSNGKSIALSCLRSEVNVLMAMKLHIWMETSKTTSWKT